jgi:hypothetical protein
LTPPQVFRSPFAVLAWWLWVAFAVANWADLAVQGHDRSSLLVALGLLLITGVVYAVALRPRVIAADDGLMVVNPLRQHRIGWAAVSAIEAAELLRVRCEWPAGKRVIHAWAVHSSRRHQAAARDRAARRTSYPLPGAPGLRAAWRATGAQGGGPPAAGPGAARSSSAGSAGPFGMSAERVVMALTERAEAGRAEAGRAEADSAQPPASRWHWPSVAAIVLPAAALLIAAL